LNGFVSFVCFVGKKTKFKEHPFPYHHELEMEISTLTNHGVGLGRVPLAATAYSTPLLPGDGPDKHRAGSSQQPCTAHSTQPEAGWVVMVPFTLPGEQVRVRVYRNHKNYSEADLLEVLTPSPHRIAPRCPLFGRCGGCQYQHLAYTEQLTWKQRQVGELLQHMAGVEFAVSSVIASPREFGYRSKITPHFNAPSGRVNPPASAKAMADKPDEPHLLVTTRPAMPIGFLKAGNRFELVDVPHCAIATDAINTRLLAVRAAILAKAETYTRGATMLLREASGAVTTDYDAVITETVGNLKLHFLARDFFQNNPFILPAFTRYVCAQAAASGARFLVDAYCGSGLFALACAPAFERVTGIEISETSVKFARENAQANGITNATFQAGDASQIFAGLNFSPGETAVVIDPPRKGCDESFLQQLFAFGPRAVVYVSCDPATQMRDLKAFLTAGYTLKSVQPFDLFPQTRHLECVITLFR
jgi:23S rRNA (uracil1939-C5)-methyltransferase/tRNA (uracil-5-)-methyltransferase